MGALRQLGKSSLAGKIILAAVGVSLLLLVESGVLLFSGGYQRRGLERVLDNGNLLQQAKQARDLVGVLKETINTPQRLTGPDGGPIFLTVIDKSRATLGEIRKIRALDAEEVQFVEEASDALEALAKVSWRPAADLQQPGRSVAGTADSFVSEQRLVAGEYLAEISDTMTKFSNHIFSDSDTVIAYLYKSRYLPFMICFGLALVLVGLALGAGLLMAGRMQRALQELTQGAHRIATGDFNFLVPIYSSDEIGQVSQSFNEMVGRLRETTVSKTQLENANKELEAFSYSVAHDLRAPLRSIDGFSKILIDEHFAVLGDEGKAHLQRVRAATQRMGTLIDDMLGLAKVTRKELRHEKVDLSELVAKVCEQLKGGAPGRNVDFKIEPGIVVKADPGLMLSLLENLLGNAFKFSGKNPAAKIEFGSFLEGEKVVIFVRDNGAGFDMQYSSKLFGIFQRMHSQEEFAGTGVGLATVKRIVLRHGGRIWVESELGKGTTFFFCV